MFHCLEKGGRIKSLQIDLNTKFLFQHRLPRRADEQMHLASARQQDFQEADRINGSAGSGDGKDERVHKDRPQSCLAVNQPTAYPSVSSKSPASTRDPGLTRIFSTTPATSLLMVVSI